MAKVANILFPADYFDKSSPDPALRAEYEAAAQEPRLDAILFDLEAFEERGKLKLSNQPQSPKLPLVYRGWMMKPARYLAFYEALFAKGLRPLVGSRDYAELHQFPLIYAKSEKLRALSPKTIAFPGGRIDALAVNAAFDRFMVKDYVKSAKNTSFPCSIPTPISQEDADSLSEAFVELRAGLFTGGIVCKEYADLAKYEEKTNEWRAFYLGGRLLNVCRNSNQPNTAPKPPEEMVCEVSGLGSPYYTVDFAEKADGEWIVVETGDGQVSGLAAAQDPVLYFTVLADAFDRNPHLGDSETSYREDRIPQENAYCYVMNGGDFACVKHFNGEMEELLKERELENWRLKKIDYLQRYDGRYVLGRTLDEAESYIIHSEFETVWLTHKSADRPDVCIGDFYGDPAGAAISPTEGTCVAYGCGAIVYRLSPPFEDYQYDQSTPQWLEVGRDPSNTLWVNHARYLSDTVIALALNDGREVILDLRGENAIKNSNRTAKENVL